MRFVFDPVPAGSARGSGREGWTPLCEPDVGGFPKTAIALPILFVIASLYVLDEMAPLLTLFLALVHTATCTGDFQTIYLLIRQVPVEAVVHNKGWQTYWHVG